MKILAYPTPTNKLHTIGEAPSFRPLGRTGVSAPLEVQPNDPTPLSCVNKKAYNSRGYTGTRASKFIQDNQFLPVVRAPGVYPLSTPGVEGLGNVGDSAPQPRPGFAEPMNGDFQNILNILNKPDNGFTSSNLSSGQLRLLAEQREKATSKPEVGVNAGERVATDFADTRKAMMKEQRIRNAVAQGFTRAEAESAYAKLRDREAEVALGTQESVSSRFADLIDSRLGGTQDGVYRNNDESALHLARNTTIAPHRSMRQIVDDDLRGGIQFEAKGVEAFQRIRSVRAGLAGISTTDNLMRGLTAPYGEGKLRVSGMAADYLRTRGAPGSFPARQFEKGQPSKVDILEIKTKGFSDIKPFQYQLKNSPSSVAAAIQEAAAAKRGRGRPAGSKDTAPRSRTATGKGSYNKSGLPADFSGVPGGGGGGRA